MPDEDGLAEMMERDSEWRESDDNLSLVAEIDCQVAGYLEEWGRSKGAVAAVCDTYSESPLSVPFWEERVGYERRAIIFRKAL